MKEKNYLNSTEIILNPTKVYNFLQTLFCVVTSVAGFKRCLWNKVQGLKWSAGYWDSPGPCFRGTGGSLAESCCCCCSERRGQRPEHPPWLLQRTACGPSAPSAPRAAGPPAAQEGRSAPRPTSEHCTRPVSWRNTSGDIWKETSWNKTGLRRVGVHISRVNSLLKLQFVKEAFHLPHVDGVPFKFLTQQKHKSDSHSVTKTKECSLLQIAVPATKTISS